MTYKRPLRLTILHLEQRLRMDAETFMLFFSLRRWAQMGPQMFTDGGTDVHRFVFRGAA